MVDIRTVAILMLSLPALLAVPAASAGGDDPECHAVPLLLCVENDWTQAIDCFLVGANVRCTAESAGVVLARSAARSPGSLTLFQEVDMEVCLDSGACSDGAVDVEGASCTWIPPTVGCEIGPVDTLTITDFIELPYQCLTVTYEVDLVARARSGTLGLELAELFDTVLLAHEETLCR